MKVCITVAPDSKLLKQTVQIVEEENPRNYLIVTTHSARDSLQQIITQLEKYLNENQF